MSEETKSAPPADDADLPTADTAMPEPTSHECPHCGGDVGKLIRSAANAEWRKARKLFETRRTKPASTEARVEKLETLVTLVVDKLFPGLRGALNQPTANEEENDRE